MSAAPGPRAFLSTAGVSLVATLAAVLAFNVAVDPYAEFGTGLVPPDDTDRHSRALKVALLARQPAPPQVLILGNSRSMRLPPAAVTRLTGRAAFNGSTAAGSAYDVLAFARYAQDRPGSRVTALIVGADTFLFDRTRVREHLFQYPLVPYLPDDVRPNPVVAQLGRVARAASADTAILSLRHLRLHLGGAEVHRNFAFLPDGMIRYLPYEDWIAEGRWSGPLPDALAAVRAAYRKDYAATDPFDPGKQRAFEQLLAESDARGTCVAAFIPPLEPGLAAALARETRMQAHHDALRAWLAGLAARHRLTVVDLSTVASFGGDAAGFVDGTHMIGPNNDRVLEAVVRATPCLGGRP